MRSIWKSRSPISFRMAGRYWRRRFPVAVTDISPERVPSRFWRRKELTIQACTGRSSMRAEIRSWPMRTRTCQFHAAENLSRRRCTTSCDSMARTECTPAICPAIPRRTAVFACRNNMRLRCSMPSASALRLLYLAERRRDATWDNRNPHSCEAAIDSQTHGSARDLTRGSDHLRPRGGRETARSPRAVACAVLSAAAVHGAGLLDFPPLRQRTLQHDPT